jgi:prepilin-type N-terminal cleavage/methylation domain-containing protein
MVAGRLWRATRSKRVHHTFMEEIFMKALTRKLRKVLRAKKLSNQKGFTLLELLVVVAILAAIAGTASIALRDTDARASAAAHVAMMDELNKGIHTYRVLQKNVLPSRFDSLLVTATSNGGVDAEPLAALGFTVSTAVAADGDAVYDAIPADVQAVLYAGGIEELRYIRENGDPEGVVAGTADCSNDHIQALIASRNNAVVAGNIFMSPDANGCGYSVAMWDGNGTAPTDLPNGVYWNGSTERLTGQPDPAGTPSAYNAEHNYAYLLTGIGPSCTLFDTNTLGGMTTVPVYRHVKRTSITASSPYGMWVRMMMPETLFLRGRLSLSPSSTALLTPRKKSSANGMERVTPSNSA